MTQDILVDLGEEYLVKNGLEATFTVGVYNDASDNLGETSDVSDITTEPTNGNYSTASQAFSAADLSGDWGVDNDNAFSFDFSDQTATEDVDTFYLSIPFQAVDTGDTATNEHLIATIAMTQTRDIGSVSSIDLDPSNLEITVT